MSYDWEPFEGGDGEFVSFKNVGDEIIGAITDIRTGKDFNGNPCPEIHITTDEGDERIVTAGQVMLKRALAEQAPQVGDRIKITYSGVGDAKPGKAPAKLFEVAVATGKGNVEPAKVKKPLPVPSDEVPF
jgi:hypothetical protein